MGRKVLGVVGGLVAGGIVMMAFAYVGGLLFPVSGRVDARDLDQVRAVFVMSPLGAKLAIILSWLGGAFAGAIAAKWLSRSSAIGWTIAILFALYILLNVIILPVDLWMRVLAVAGALLAGIVAARLFPVREHVGPIEGEPDAAL